MMTNFLLKKKQSIALFLFNKLILKRIDYETKDERIKCFLPEQNVLF